MKNQDLKMDYQHFRNFVEKFLKKDILVNIVIYRLIDVENIVLMIKEKQVFMKKKKKLSFEF